MTLLTDTHSALLPGILLSAEGLGSKQKVQIVLGCLCPRLHRNRVDGRFHCRLRNALSTKLSACKSTIYLQYKSIESNFYSTGNSTRLNMYYFCLAGMLMAEKLLANGRGSEVRCSSPGSSLTQLTPHVLGLVVGLLKVFPPL